MWADHGTVWYDTYSMKRFRVDAYTRDVVQPGTLEDNKLVDYGLFKLN